MKKTYLIVSALALMFATFIAKAQLINPAFETWTTDVVVPSSMNPNAGNNTYGWWDFNYFNYSLLGSSPISVTRCSDTVHNGTYSARIETKAYTSTSWNIYKLWGIPFIGHEYNDTLGIVFNGKVNVLDQSFKPGTACSQKLTQFKFYYQYKPHGNDTAECRVELLKSGVPVAGGWFKTGDPTDGLGWQQATIDFTYVNALTPDTLWVIFSSSSFDRKPKAGSVFWIDDATVTLPTGIEQPLETLNKMEIFPNPSTGSFTVQLQPGNYENQNIEIFNVTGEMVYYAAPNAKGVCDINLSDAPKGIYFVKLFDGENISVEKMVIQ
jgi:hypothetical protein